MKKSTQDLKQNTDPKKSRSTLFWIICLAAAALVASLVFSSCNELDDNQTMYPEGNAQTTEAQPLQAGVANLSDAALASEYKELLSNQVFQNFWPMSAVVFTDSLNNPIDTIYVGKNQSYQFVGFCEQGITGMVAISLDPKAKQKE